MGNKKPQKVSAKTLKKLAAALNTVHSSATRNYNEDNICPVCGGSGQHSADKYEDGEVVGRATWKCNECDGTGFLNSS